jgi:hypothetical protein
VCLDRSEGDVDPELPEPLDDAACPVGPFVPQPFKFGRQRLVSRVDPEPEDVDRQAFVLGRELRAQHQVEVAVRRGGTGCGEPLGRVVIGDPEPLEPELDGPADVVLDGRRPVGADAVGVQVVAGHAGLPVGGLAQKALWPVSRRPMIRCWTWLVPSYRVVTRASRSSRWTGYSSMYP